MSHRAWGLTYPSGPHHSISPTERSWIISLRQTRSCWVRSQSSRTIGFGNGSSRSDRISSGKRSSYNGSGLIRYRVCRTFTMRNASGLKMKRSNARSLCGFAIHLYPIRSANLCASSIAFNGLGPLVITGTCYKMKCYWFFFSIASCYDEFCGRTGIYLRWLIKSNGSGNNRPGQKRFSRISDNCRIILLLKIVFTVAPHQNSPAQRSLRTVRARL